VFSVAIKLNWNKNCHKKYRSKEKAEKALPQKTQKHRKIQLGFKECLEFKRIKTLSLFNLWQ
jgi:hypothetical protein